MRYANGKTVNLRDQVVGIDAAGRPIAGEVVGTNVESNSVQVSPAFHHPMWVGSDRCVRAEDVPFTVPAEATPAASVTQPAAPVEEVAPAPNPASVAPQPVPEAPAAE